ncbi:hypothetical protein NGM10_02045 [Halorussus salilacus]|uniref:hypothetical protein n=1 Tax=Halorussus salilacus TaxID=2953750 RepID=UPI0020A0E416|nr:hypothetical protein [Halorussus salilacus]USZ68533.1 hypothetical protein NGM10_02045 [Halorussus salilacus]
MTDRRMHRVLRALLHREHRALQREYDVRPAADEQTIVLDAVELPEGWEPRTIDIRIELSEHHPRNPPKWVLPGELRLNGRVPRHILSSGHWLARGQLGDPIIYWPTDWDPARSSLRQETDVMLADLLTADAPGREASDA